MKLKVLIALTILGAATSVEGVLSDSEDTQFTIQGALLEGVPTFVFKSPDVLNCPLRFRRREDPLDSHGQPLVGAALWVQFESTCEDKANSEFDIIVAKFSDDGTLGRLYAQALIEERAAVERCARLEKIYQEKYDGDLNKLTSEERQQMAKGCTIIPFDVGWYRLLIQEPLLKDWKNRWHSSNSYTIPIHELLNEENKPTLNSDDLRQFNQDRFVLEFNFYFEIGDYDALRARSIAVRFSDLSKGKLSTLYNRYSLDLDVNYTTGR